MESSQKLALLKSNLLDVAYGVRFPNDPFFEKGNKIISSLLKNYGIFEADDEDLLHKQTPKFKCCHQSFDTVFLYDQHYNINHRYSCTTCKKTLSTPHLLDLHVSEIHDSFFAVAAEKTPMYACFSEECKLKFDTPAMRKDHAITEHAFPSFWCDQHFPPSANEKMCKNKARAHSKIKKPVDTCKDGTDACLEEASAESMEVCVKDKDPKIRGKKATPKEKVVATSSTTEQMQVDMKSDSRRPAKVLGSGHSKRGQMFSFVDLRECLPKLDK